jgi:hypothetical protein
MTDENFVVDAEFMRNVFAVFGTSGGLQLSLFAIVDGTSWRQRKLEESCCG